MNPFEAYGASAAPTIPDNRANRRKKNPSALDRKMEEKQRLTKRYLALQREQRKALLAREPRLLDFMRYLRGVGPDQADELLEAIEASWLPAAPLDVRMFALRRIDRRSDKIKLMLGLEPLDDPLPPETSVYFEAKRILGVR